MNLTNPVIGHAAIKRVSLNGLGEKLIVIAPHKLIFLLVALLRWETRPDEVPEVARGQRDHCGLPVDNHDVVPSWVEHQIVQTVVSMDEGERLSVLQLPIEQDVSDFVQRRDIYGLQLPFITFDETIGCGSS